MKQGVELIIWLLLAFQLKHLIADFFLQTAYQYMNKGTYGHPGGLLHSGIHGVLTLLVLLALAPIGWGFAVIVSLVETVVHYHVDWSKENFVKSKSLNTEQAGFWYALGVDQFVHQITYIAILALVI
jgi:hypothetical protein